MKIHGNGGTKKITRLIKFNKVYSSAKVLIMAR